VEPCRLGQRGRVVGQTRVHVAHLAQEDLPDLGPAVDGRDQDVRRRPRQLDDQLGQAVVGRNPWAASASFSPISSVASDLT
jgi:hypothetical protein